MRIHLTKKPGDILLLSTGQQNIDTTAEILYSTMRALGLNVPELIILPVYSALPSEMQTRIFDPAPPGCRKCVIATNVAEASLTIDGIYFAVDLHLRNRKCSTQSWEWIHLLSHQYRKHRLVNVVDVPDEQAPGSVSVCTRKPRTPMKYCRVRSRNCREATLLTLFSR